MSEIIIQLLQFGLDKQSTKTNENVRLKSTQNVTIKPEQQQ